jgi:phage shock protein E
MEFAMKWPFSMWGGSGGGAPQGGAPAVLADGSVVIDVRSESEFAGGALQGAVNVPLNVLDRRIADVVPDKATPVVLYCASGGRSGMAARHLQQQGYTQVVNAGGLLAASATLGRPIR